MTTHFEISIGLPSGRVVTHKYPTNRKAAHALATFRRAGFDPRAYVVERRLLDLTDADGTLVLGPHGSPPPSPAALAGIDETAVLTDDDRKAIDGLGDGLVDRLLDSMPRRRDKDGR